jgi:hypothetical protein
LYSGSVVRNFPIFMNVQDFNYIGVPQEFIAPIEGNYLLETWGASGQDTANMAGNNGGKGGYSIGNKELNKDSTLYSYVGGTTLTAQNSPVAGANGGWNGGGNGGNGGNAA